MSDGESLCPFTAVARGMNAALKLFLSFGQMFTAEELKSTCNMHDSTQGRHTGVRAVDRDKLNALLASKNITEEQFKAAMFTNALMPERLQQLKDNLAEVQRLAVGNREGQTEQDDE